MIPWSLKHAVVLACVALVAAGCGRRGPLEPPGGVPQSAATPPSLIDAIAAPTRQPTIETPKPDKPFVLDSLI